MDTLRSPKFWTWAAAGSAIFALTLWLVLTPPGLFGKASAIAYAVCHRIPSHSFFVNGQQFPLCARCTGMYLGALLGVIYQSFFKRRGGMLGWKQAVPFILLAVAFAVDGVNSYLHFFPGAPDLYQPENWLRLVTGTGMGLSISAVLVPAFRQTVWQGWDEHPVLASWRQVAGLIGLGALLDLAFLTGSPLVLYPAALLSPIGVLVLLTMVYCMVWLLVLRRENQMTALAQLAAPLAGGLTVAVIQIGLIDWGRLLLTGTWAGFNL